MPKGADPARLFVDSGAWFALASASDRHHAEANGHLRAAVEDGWKLITTNLVVAEVHRLVLHRFGIRPARNFLERLEASKYLTLVHATAEEHSAAIAWLSRFGDQPITYTDAVSFAVMKATHCRAALTFDRHFEIAGFQRWRG